jgi:hypothetical protein
MALEFPETNLCRILSSICARESEEADVKVDPNPLDKLETPLCSSVKSIRLNPISRR